MVPSSQSTRSKLQDLCEALFSSNPAEQLCLQFQQIFVVRPLLRL
jgi:hypothetical protein